MAPSSQTFDGLGPNGRKALRGLEITERLVRQAGQPGFTEERWSELAELYAGDEFRRIAANRESRDWDEDIRLRHQFALMAEFSFSIRRIAEVGNTVYVDTIETVKIDSAEFSVNTLGVIEFNQAGLIFRSTTYQQWDPGRVPGHVARPGDLAGLGVGEDGPS
jgi:hypothetical protein